MDKHKKEILEAAGWKGGTVAEFLELTPEQSALVELKLQMSNALRDRRKKIGLSQRQLAKNIQSSQSRVAKMEADDPSVSLDLLIRGLFATGVGLEGLSKIVYSKARRPAKAI